MWVNLSHGQGTQKMPPVCSGARGAFGCICISAKDRCFTASLLSNILSMWGQFKAEMIVLLKILAEQIYFIFNSAKQNGMWVKTGFSPSTCAATLWIAEHSLEHRRAIAAVEKCQHGALFPAFLTSVVVLVGWSCAAASLLVLLLLFGHSAFVRESGHLEERDSGMTRTSLSHTREFLTWRMGNRMPL